MSSDWRIRVDLVAQSRDVESLLGGATKLTIVETEAGWHFAPSRYEFFGNVYGSEVKLHRSNAEAKKNARRSNRGGHARLRSLIDAVGGFDVECLQDERPERWRAARRHQS